MKGFFCGKKLFRRIVIDWHYFFLIQQDPLENDSLCLKIYKN